MNDVNRTAAAAPEPTVAEVAASRRRRFRLPLMIGGVVVIVVAITAYYLAHRRYESTEDAYVNAARVAISSNVPGRVVKLDVRDNQRVKRGDVLFRLDDRPFQLAVSEAQARLDQAMLDVEAMKATYRQKQSELRSARDTLNYEQRESERQQQLADFGHFLAGAGGSRDARAGIPQSSRSRLQAAACQRARKPRRRSCARCAPASGSRAGAGRARSREAGSLIRHGHCAR